MKYITAEWPEIQDYMNRPDFPEKCYYDPNKNMWLIPETWTDPYCDLSDTELKDIYDDMQASFYELFGENWND